MTSRTVAIIGLGLIGGSLGLALKRAARTTAAAEFAPEIFGFDPKVEARELARARGAIDHAADDPAHAAANAELVIVAVPVLEVRAVFAAIAPALRRDAVVTDVASTKVAVCAWAAELLPGAFIGGHPMAGSERSGIAHARADLFDGATYCLTPEPATPEAALSAASALVRAVGAQAQLLDPATHDRAVAAISHLPFLLSTALVEAVADSPEWAIMRTVAATGFRDVSRLASGDPHMHRDICLTNAAAIRTWLLQAARMLETLADELDDEATLLRRFEHAKAIRDALVYGDSPGDESPG